MLYLDFSYKYKMYFCIICRNIIEKPQAEALYARLGFVHVSYKDFFGHAMKHMVKEL